MSIRDYEYELRSDMRDLNAVICVYQKPGTSGRSPINAGLEAVIAELKREIPDYKVIQVAYVYETKGLQNCIPFEQLTSGTEPYYMEPIREVPDHNLDHVLFMGMAMLEQKKRINGGECRLYLVTDDRFKSGNEVVWHEDGMPVMNPKLNELNAAIIIVKQERTGGEEIEQVVENQLAGKVRMI